MNETNDWTSPEYMGNIAAEELHGALNRVGVNVIDVVTDDDGDVHIYFSSIQDAEAMMTLAMYPDGPGSMYDRSTDKCVSLNALPLDATEDQVKAVIVGGWTWHVHPHMTGRRMNWHVKVCLPTLDANQLAASLNALIVGGAL